MRSRYSAYVKKEMDYLATSLHPDHRADYDEKSSREWAERAQWHGFEIVKTSQGGPDDREGQVEFIASYTESGVKTNHHELSSFKKEGDRWYFTVGKNLPPKQVVNTAPKSAERPCPAAAARNSRSAAGSDSISDCGFRIAE
jgi:SEC-C motif-containing protein